MNRYIKTAIALLLAMTFLASCGKKVPQSVPDEPSVKDENTVMQPSVDQPTDNENVGNDKNEDDDPGSDVTGPSDYKLRINEVLYENSVYRFGGKDAYNFIELHNYGSEDIDLSGFTLSVSGGQAELSGLLKAKAYLLVLPGMEGDTTVGLGALTLRLSPKCTVTLEDNEGKMIQAVTLPELKKDISYAYGAPTLGVYTDTDYVKTGFVTPGYENSEEGLNKWYQNNDTAVGLVINEAMSANREYLETLGAYYDWIELYNNSDTAIQLEDYYLSDKESNLKKWNLPKKSLAPGETFLVFAETDDAQKLISRGYICCGFSLSADREQIYLSNAEGVIMDAMLIMGTTQNGSYGRMEGQGGFFYFPTPTPQKKNENGTRTITTTPMLSNTGGVYNGVGGVQVSIKGEGTIYYTLDGSVPTKDSRKYNGGSISMSQTGVLRAVSVVDGKITGRAATASFIINENHTLPVLSIAIDPEDMYGDKTGIYVVGEGNDPGAWSGEANYTKDWEKTVYASYFEGEGKGFMLDCGIKIAGSGTRAYDKKSFQLKFRGIYGTADLEYDIFGTGIETFQNIKLRCGEDYFRATFRDELQASLVMDGMDSLLAQRYRWFVLYIDSEYFGLYAFRDMTDENYIAKAENTEASNVTKLECDGNNKISTNKDFINLVNFCYTKDLSIEENYKYVTDRLDIASVTQWFIARSYSNDRDFGNCRYYRIGDDGKWKWIFYDCDWGFYYEYMPRSPYDILASDYHLAFPTVKIMIGLFKSPIYRDYYCQELAKHLKTTYNTAHILERIEELNATVLPEIPRDRERWPQGSYDKYLTMVEDMRNFAKDCPSYFVKSTAKFLSLSDAQVRAYFGDIIYG